MKLNLAEKLLVNNPVRALVQRYYEGPLLREMGGELGNARVLDVGCGRGVGAQVLLEQLAAGQVYGIDLDPRQVRRAQPECCIMSPIGKPLSPKFGAF